MCIRGVGEMSVYIRPIQTSCNGYLCSIVQSVTRQYARHLHRKNGTQNYASSKLQLINNYRYVIMSNLQDFVRSTRKYWVHTEDVSRVKYIILQHLPVFLQNTMAGETDSQLVNSVRACVSIYLFEINH